MTDSIVFRTDGETGSTMVIDLSDVLISSCQTGGSGADMPVDETGGGSDGFVAETEADAILIGLLLPAVQKSEADDGVDDLSAGGRDAAVALLLPAVQQAREAARRSTCDGSDPLPAEDLSLNPAEIEWIC